MRRLPNLTQTLLTKSWREIFQQLPVSQGARTVAFSNPRLLRRRLAKESTRYHTSVNDPAMDSKQVKSFAALINAFRFRGHQKC